MGDSEDFEKVRDDAKNMITKVMNDISKSSTTQQLLIGTASGWTTGYITMKVGKTAAFAIGGGIILLQIAQNQGYIRIDWDRIRKKAANTTEAVENNLSRNTPTWMDQVKKFISKNSCFAGGFLGGFFIGIAT
ncbi:fun14 domain containing [Holotrichia oblita]|uniref:Fun14 domain containing n=2 Tax=Holotrichia oblita TaxID=644536 RepID=A0ACB9SW53_HOLOL|nr:fun14 domain containing [Holotrichia oblita]KAI4458794.1 fun14 domain containing [Holotrichia oblita]